MKTKEEIVRDLLQLKQYKDRDERTAALDSIVLDLLKIKVDGKYICMPTYTAEIINIYQQAEAAVEKALKQST